MQSPSVPETHPSAAMGVISARPVRSYCGGLKPCTLPRARPVGCRRPLPVILVVAVRDLLTLFEHVIFGLVVGNRGGCRGLLAILGVIVGVLVVGVLILGVAVSAGCHGRESSVPVSGMQKRLVGVWLPAAAGPDEDDLSVH